MDILSQAHRGVVAAPEGDQAGDAGVEAELARLRAQVALLEAERAALWWETNHDELTGLANRRRLNALGPKLLGRTGRCAVVVLDLNGFKPINDRYGHAVGDQVLRTVGGRLSRCVGNDLAVRLSGDEFAAILTETPPAGPGPGGHWTAPVSAIADAIAEPMTIDDTELTVTASIGVATADGGTTTIAELIRRADLAMYRAKANRYCSYVVWD
ncbi:GGDEF domain-containing protein [Dactylosporangium sp. CA-092794]|uniref:GGDEF domain-containing protein n=1 Tax=Dactylosporangium sp. CA-092794 TaxID=3239929 RepID=UPI003D8AD5FF